MSPCTRGKNARGHSPPAWRGAEGLTFIEAAIAVTVTLALAGALASVGHVVLKAHDATADSWRASELGLGLLDEIASLPFDDPQNGETTLGPEAGEWLTPRRVQFDDVDDYTVWTNQPLQRKDGTLVPLPYRQNVNVAWVMANSFALTSIAPTAFKRITVSVLTTAGDTLGVYTTVRANGGRDVDYAF